MNNNNINNPYPRFINPNNIQAAGQIANQYLQNIDFNNLDQYIYIYLLL